MTKRNKVRRHCGNCENRGVELSGPEGAYFQHAVCQEASVGAVHSLAFDWRCVCDNVDRKNRPKGCPGWARRES